jgi:nucleotide-binding universal stress UspA family protein
LGAPSAIEERLGQLIGSSNLPPPASEAIYGGVAFKNILVPLDQSPLAEQSITVAQTLSRAYNAKLKLLTVLESQGKASPNEEATARRYLDDVAEQLAAAGIEVETELRRGSAPEQIGELARTDRVDAVVMSTHGRSRLRRLVVSSITTAVIHQTTPPLIVIRPTDEWRSTRTRFERLLVALDGSAISEQILPHVREIAQHFGSDVLLLSVPEGSESDDHPEKLKTYLDEIAAELGARGIGCRTLVEGSAPAQTLLRVATEQDRDLIMTVSHGRGGVARQDHVKLGSVVDRLLQETPCPVFLVSAVSA